MITKLAKIEITAKDEKELQTMGNLVQSFVNLPKREDINVTNEHLIKLLTVSHNNPQMLINALKFLG